MAKNAAQEILGEIRIKLENPSKVLEALKPDIEETNRFKAEIIAEKNKLVLKINASDLSAMRAALNSYLRLINTIKEVDKIG